MLVGLDRLALGLLHTPRLLLGRRLLLGLTWTRAWAWAWPWAWAWAWTCAASRGMGMCMGLCMGMGMHQFMLGGL
eukprot:11771004-Heterocapsa_arctica.AAC.1